MCVVPFECEMHTVSSQDFRSFCFLSFFLWNCNIHFKSVVIWQIFFLTWSWLLTFSWLQFQFQEKLVWGFNFEYKASFLKQFLLVTHTMGGQKIDVKGHSLVFCSENCSDLLREKCFRDWEKDLLSIFHPKLSSTLAQNLVNSSFWIFVPSHHWKKKKPVSHSSK